MTQPQQNILTAGLILPAPANTGKRMYAPSAHALAQFFVLYPKGQCMKKENIQGAARILLGCGLVFAGISHLTFARKEFQSQVPDWVPLQKDDTVVYSGIAEIALGSALISSGKGSQSLMGKIAAGFFVGVFPGNWAQFKNRRKGFGLDNDKRRFARLILQPLLVYWALKSTKE